MSNTPESLADVLAARSKKFYILDNVLYRQDPIEGVAQPIARVRPHSPMKDTINQALAMDIEEGQTLQLTGCVFVRRFGDSSEFYQFFEVVDGALPRAFC